MAAHAYPRPARRGGPLAAHPRPPRAALALLAAVVAAASAVAAAGLPAAAADKGTYVDAVEFIQYLDENTALEEVRNGNLDLYYFTVPADRVKDAESRRGLRVYESTGGSYSLLVNPAEPSDGSLNPFSMRDVRYALNYLVDRRLLVNELMGGHGTPMVSNYGPSDPDYIGILGLIESYGFEHNPSLASSMIDSAMAGAGAHRGEGGLWMHGGGPVEVRVFIRSDDPVRESVGEILASALEDAGFAVGRDYGDLNKAFVVVYGSDPAEMQWSVYTEGWGGRSAFVRYDPVGLGQMYAPWYSSMPGFNDPSYWNYENALLDSLTQRIYAGEYGSAAERAELVRAATAEAVSESVRVFLAARTDLYAGGPDVEGVVNDFGAGVPSRFTPINARPGGSDVLRVGVKQIYQGSWNPVVGFGDTYSTQIWNALSDPGTFYHPYSGRIIPVRAEWDVEGAAGGAAGVPVPRGAVLWSPAEQRWEPVPDGTRAQSRVTFDLLGGRWHHGAEIDMRDVMYSLYFAVEWGSAPGAGGGQGAAPAPADRTFDSEYTPRAAQVVDTMVGVRPVDADTIEVYLDYWHFDEAEIAAWASVWPAMPWEVYHAMESVVLDGSASFSRSGSVARSVPWLSLIVPNDAQLVADALRSARDAGAAGVPPPLAGLGATAEYAAGRYDSALEWIGERNHAVVGNGPFYLESYSPESRTIRIAAFDDESYPLPAGHWAGLEDVRFPEITGVDAPDVVVRGRPASIDVEAEGASTLHYFVSGPPAGPGAAGTVSGSVDIAPGSATVLLDGADTSALGAGGGRLRLFAVSDDVLRPDAYSAGFLAIDEAAAAAAAADGGDAAGGPALPDMGGGGAGGNAAGGPGSPPPEYTSIEIASAVASIAAAAALAVAAAAVLRFVKRR